MDVSALTALSPASLLAAIPAFLAGFIQPHQPRERCREHISSLVADWTPEQAQQLLADILSAGTDFTTYPANSGGRLVSRAWCSHVITGATVRGLQYLQEASVAGAPVVLCNHLSYIDASATDALLVDHGQPDLADRLLFAAGPKVYQHMFRRVAAASLNTVQVPQSTSFSHTNRLSGRDLAKRAMASMDAAKLGVQRGMIPLLYPEGSRSRDRRLQSFLRGVHRYLRLVPDMIVVPAVIVGTDRMMGVGNDEKILPSRASLEFLEPLVVGKHGDSRQLLAASFERIAAKLPENQRPLPSTEPVA